MFPLQTLEHITELYMKSFNVHSTENQSRSFLLPFCKGDSVTQTEGHVAAAKGGNVTLECTFETNSFGNPYLFWYKKEENKRPSHILTRLRGTGINSKEFNKERFDAILQDASIPLKIQDLRLSDSAVYYCALQPTVTGNTRTLYKNL
uniref:Ig-like domain-containing protein n=1 Tax=Cyprinodon variegatus TaxID=28743 RepID=A0A3Q2CLM9_CYPVA